MIGADLFIKGEVRNGREVHVQGLIDGALTAEHVVVFPGGRLFGTLVADSAEINGELQGHVLVRKLIRIGATGAVRGDVRYGSIVMDPGAELSADMRNVPPAIAGDLNLAVKRGQAARITTEDLTAIDPDSPVQSLVFAVSGLVKGFVALGNAAATPVARFTQADLQSNAMFFVHDGSAGETASFDVIVTDDAGASSSNPQTVNVAVFG